MASEPEAKFAIHEAAREGRSEYIKDEGRKSSLTVSSSDSGIAVECEPTFYTAIFITIIFLIDVNVISSRQIRNLLPAKTTMNVYQYTGPQHITGYQSWSCSSPTDTSTQISRSVYLSYSPQKKFLINQITGWFWLDAAYDRCELEERGRGCHN
jgi:hypothetical protein